MKRNLFASHHREVISVMDEFDHAFKTFRELLANGQRVDLVRLWRVQGDICRWSAKLSRTVEQGVAPTNHDVLGAKDLRLGL